MIDQQDDSLTKNEEYALALYMDSYTIHYIVGSIIFVLLLVQRKKYKLYDFSDAHPSEVVSRQSRDSYRVRNNQTSEITEQLM
ncbi:hypothetical protein pb186bvf_016837 [Paramecium bursaria]